MKKIIFLLLICTNAHAADISQEHRIQVLLKENIGGVEYNDAIYYTQEEWDSLKQEDVDSEISKRLQIFEEAVKNQKPEPEPTKEELEETKAMLESQIAELDQKISMKTSKESIGILESMKSNQ